MQHLSDLDELLQLVRSSYVRDYVKEAITAYRAGAYRASVTTTWVAVCVDVIEKIRELAIQDDGAAKDLANQIERIQDNTNTQQMLKFEDQILDFACDTLEFITPLEKMHLKRLKEDRNICAHPTFQKQGKHFNISPENARLHIVQAANFLFIQSPTMGKAKVSSLYELIAKETFPEDNEKAYQLLSSERYLKRAKDVVPRNLLVLIFKRIFADDDPIDQLQAKQMFASINAISRMFPEVSQNLIADKFNAFLADTDTQKLKRVYPLLFQCPELWTPVEEAIKERIIHLVSRLSVYDIIHYNVPKCSDHIVAFVETLIEKVEGLTSKEKSKIIDHCPARAFKNQAIKVFLQSGSYASAYENGIDNLLPHAPYYSFDDLKTIFEGCFKNNQIFPAGGIDQVFKDLYEVTRETIPDALEAWRDFLIKANEVEQYHNKELEELLAAEGFIVPRETEIEVELEDDTKCPF